MKTIGAYIKRARDEMYYRYPTVDDELCATALDACDEFMQEIAKLLPLDTPVIGEGTRYAVPQERIEAAKADALDIIGATLTGDSEEKVSRAIDAALRTALGEVLPVEAVGQFTLLPGDEPVACLMPRVPGKAGTAPVIDEGRTVALITHGEDA